MMEVTKHQNDLLCACPDCRSRKGDIVYMAEKLPIERLWSPQGIEPSIHEPNFKTIRYRLNQYVDVNGFYYQYDRE